MRLQSISPVGNFLAKIASITLVLGLALLPTAANAASITESFTVAPQNNLEFSSGDFFLSTSNFAQFNPLTGKLNSISAALYGPAIWSSNSNQPELYANLVDGYMNDIGHDPNYGVQTFQNVGQIYFQLYNTADGASDILGSGQTNFYLGLNVVVGSEIATAYLSTSGLDGNITYNYTPVPEPGSLILLASGLFGLAIIRRRKQK